MNLEKCFLFPGKFRNTENNYCTFSDGLNYFKARNWENFEGVAGLPNITIS
jgi:hypothetical protein